LLHQEIVNESILLSQLMLGHLELCLEASVFVFEDVGRDSLPHDIVVESFSFLLDHSRTEFANLDVPGELAWSNWDAHDSI
jgi:hypothetical protein